MNTQIVCYEQENRFTMPYMIEDRLSTAEKVSNLKKVSKKRDEIARESGFESGDDAARFILETFSENKIKELQSEVESTVRRMYAPNFVFSIY